MDTFKTREEYQAWIEGQDWYQTITLKNGLVTPGKVATQLRAPVLDSIDFKGASVIDIGCNSGHYSFMAKARGASRVVGVDINEKRIRQAQTLAANEGEDIDFRLGSILDVKELGRFDIVLCIAVVTEIQDLFGALEVIKNATGKMALIEIGLAKPLAYLSASRQWFHGYRGISRRNSLAEVVLNKNGQFALAPTLPLLELAFGPEFSLTRKPGGIRYDLVEITRRV